MKNTALISITERELDDRWVGTIGANIQFQRKKAGLTQERLAEAASLAPRTIQKIEAGSITILITTLKRIRDAIGCPYELLLSDKTPLKETPRNIEKEKPETRNSAPRAAR